MATVTITHSVVEGGTVDATAAVDGAAWDDAHVVVGLENIDNTSDADKPVSTAQAAAIAAVQADADAAQSDVDTHIANTSNPHSVTKAQVGLGNADNTSDANKPISTATQTALDAKVTGPASVTDDLPAIFDGTTGKLVKQKTYAAFKTLLALVKGDVGLGNVDNTSDANKPVSTAQQTALDLKANLASPTFTGTPAAPTAAPGTNTTQVSTTAFVKAAIDVVLGGVSAAFDTLSEIATAIGLKADIASPTFTGIPAAPTAAAATSTTQIATTAFVTTADNLKANIASPTFTGTPAAPTASAGTNTTQLATTAFVKSAIDAVLGGVSSAFDTLSEIATDLGLKALKTTTISAGSGLTGGGDLSANRSLAVDAASQADQEAGSSAAKVVTPSVQQHHKSALKAWVNFNGSGTPAVVLGYNVSSITDNGTGDHTINFTNAMSGTTYGIMVSQEEVSPTDTAYPLNTFVRTGGRATGSVRVYTVLSGPAKTDAPAVFVGVFGDM